MTGLAQDHTVGQLYMVSNDLSLENHGEDWVESVYSFYLGKEP